MTLLGAGGETASELAAALALPAGPGRDAALKEGTEALMQRVASLGARGVQFALGNGIFMQKSYQVHIDKF